MIVDTCNIAVDRYGQELVQHGSSDFPAACYCDDLNVHPVPWHWHEELEAIIVIEGDMLVGSENEQYVVHAGEGFVINSGVLHGCWDHEASHCKIHSVVFHSRLVGGTSDSIFYQNYLRPLMQGRMQGGILLSPKESWQSEVLEHIESAWELVQKEPLGYEFDVRHHLSQMLLLLYQNLSASASDLDRKTMRDSKRIKQMLQFIQEHFAEKITVAEIAGSASVSESECLRCFRSTVRITPNQYLRQYRIEQAAHLLAATQEKISVIANACGFEDLSFFAKSFREMQGKTPSEYRAHRENM